MFPGSKYNGGGKGTIASSGRSFDLDGVPDSKNRLTFTLPFPEDAQDVVACRYSVRFNSDGGSSWKSDGGYDFARSKGEALSWATGEKLPGLIFGNPGDATGGNLKPETASLRLMTRGGHSTGNNRREHVTLVAYLYTLSLIHISEPTRPY